MTEELDPQAKLAERLRALGSRPVDPPVASAHLTALASVQPLRRGRQRLAVAGALFAGTLIGSTGLAAAGALPAPAQKVAHSALAKVNVEVPKGGTERYDGPECAGDTPARNRGQYLKQERAKGAEALAAAKLSRCGMPLNADADEANTGDETPSKADKAEAKKAKAEANKAKAEANKDKAGADAEKGKADSGQDPVDGAGTDKAGRPDKTGKPAGDDVKGSGKPAEPGKSDCVERGQGNAGGAGQANRPADPGQPTDPGRPGVTGKPAKTGKPAVTGAPECTQPTDPGPGGGS